VLLPGDRCKAEAINVLLSGAETEGVLLLGERRTGRIPQGECCYRGIVVKRKPLYYYRGRKQREYCYWGVYYKEILLPGERRKVLLLGRRPQQNTATGEIL